MNLINNVVLYRLITTGEYCVFCDDKEHRFKTMDQANDFLKKVYKNIEMYASYSNQTMIADNTSDPKSYFFRPEFSRSVAQVNKTRLMGRNNTFNSDAQKKAYRELYGYRPIIYKRDLDKINTDLQLLWLDVLEWSKPLTAAAIITGVALIGACSGAKISDKKKCQDTKIQKSGPEYNKSKTVNYADFVNQSTR